MDNLELVVLMYIITTLHLSLLLIKRDTMFQFLHSNIMFIPPLIHQQQDNIICAIHHLNERHHTSSITLMKNTTYRCYNCLSRGE